MNSPQAPAFAAHRPERAVEIHEVDGRRQAVCWDRATDHRRVLSHAPDGVGACDIEPDGDFVWWFDADPAGQGRWLRQPFEGGPPSPALNGVPVGRPYGIAFDGDGRLCVVCVGVGPQTLCYLGPPGGPGQLLASAPGYVGLVDLTADGRLIALAGRADDARAVSVIRLADGRVDVLPGSPAGRIWALEFRAGPELLVIVEAGGYYTIGTWRADRGVELAEHLAFDSEITAHWYGDGRRLLIQQDRAGRSQLFLADLDTGARTVVPTPTGSILDLAGAPEGTIHYVWSRESVPPRGLVTDPTRPDLVAPASSGDEFPGPGSPGRAEVWTPQPYGRIHSFLATPPGAGPWPTLFLVDHFVNVSDVVRCLYASCSAGGSC